MFTQFGYAKERIDWDRKLAAPAWSNMFLWEITRSQSPPVYLAHKG